MSAGIPRIVNHVVCHVLISSFPPIPMRKEIAVLSIAAFIFILDAVPNARAICADDKYEFATLYRSDTHRRAAARSKEAMCKVLEIHDTLYGPWKIEQASAYSYDSSKLCSGSGSLASNKDEGSKRAAKVAREKLCKINVPEKVKPITIEPWNARCYSYMGKCLSRPVKQRNR